MSLCSPHERRHLRAALALRAEHADLVGYGQGSYTMPVKRGDSILRTVEQFRMEDGTDTPRAMLAPLQRPRPRRHRH